MVTVVKDKASRDLVEEGLATIPDAQAFLSLSRSTLYALMDEGKLAFVTIGRRRLIPRRALVDLAARGLRGT